MQPKAVHTLQSGMDTSDEMVLYSCKYTFEGTSEECSLQEGNWQSSFVHQITQMLAFERPISGHHAKREVKEQEESV